MLGLMRVRRAMLLAGLVVLLLVVAVGVVPSVALGAGWSVVPSPTLSGEEPELDGVSCVSASACIAVGTSGVRGISVAERWDGTRWATLPTADPPGAVSSRLSGVSCVSASACTAVGNFIDSAGAQFALAEQWNGTRWVIQTAPNHPGELLGVSCVSANACAAVGDTYANVAFAERWNGTRWVIQSAPNPHLSQSSSLSGVSCVSANACTAVGVYVPQAAGTLFGGALVERWDGTRWAIQPAPNRLSYHDNSYDELSGVSCVSANACTAVGGFNEVLTLAERWDGTRWAIQRAPNPGSAQRQLTGVSCVSTRACIAVGTNYPDGPGNLSLAELWDGMRWVVQPTPNSPHSSGLLYGVSCGSASACVAVGDGGLIESWTAPTGKFTVSHIKAAADGTITFSLRVPGPGRVDVLGTAWQDNLARAAVLLKPAPERFVFARQHAHAAHGGAVSVRVKPNRRGRWLVARHRYRVVLRLWVTYTPRGGLYRTVGFFGLHPPGSCANHNAVTARKWRRVVRCN
jgi:hypothetical protein